VSSGLSASIASSLALPRGAGFAFFAAGFAADAVFAGFLVFAIFAGFAVATVFATTVSLAGPPTSAKPFFSLSATSLAFAFASAAASPNA
jgi:hypothetical protein